ncbi:MAG: aminotransferase [Chloroflexota bacterium]
MQQTINDLDRAHHIHPFNNIRQLKDEGVLVIDKADGIYIYDEAGKQYIDGMAGLWCVNLGYGRQELAEAAHRQMNALPYYNTFFQSTTAPAAQLAAKLTALAPDNINHAFFANSGSEANDTIVRMVRTYWDSVGQPERRAIISRVDSYHGSTMVGASLCGLDYMHPIADLPLPGFHHIAGPYPYRDGATSDLDAYGLQMANLLEQKILELGPENVGAFHADTIASGGGVLVPPDSYWPEIVRICQKYDVLLSIDEVICGFGRVGAWLSTELYDLQPDFISVAKGLSSGYAPISAALVSDRVMEGLQASDSGFFHGFTYSGHPVSAAVALENIRLLEEEGIITQVASDTGDYLQAKLQELSDHPLVGEVRGRGMIAAVELVAVKTTRKPFDPFGKVGKLCFKHGLANGLISRPINDTMAFSPPLPISRAQIDKMVAIFRRCLDLTQQEV